MNKRFLLISLFFISISLLWISCNADILINNGEITLPENNTSKDEGTGTDIPPVELAKPTRVNATKSYYADSINITWSAVPGADYYTIEKTAHEEELLQGTEVWTEIQQSIMSTSFKDHDNLQPSMYYSYRVTAHTNEGVFSPVSASSTGTILASPEVVTVSQGESESEIYVIWEQMPHVNSYIIYMSSGDTISGVASEVKATVASREGVQNGYAYQIDPNRESGKELAFGICSVGDTGNRSDISLPRIGYTIIPGAPSQPDINPQEDVTKGTSTSGITIKFRTNAENPDFLIRRSSPGSSEEVILDTSTSEADRDNITAISANEYEFTDYAVARNVEYTYSVIAINDVGMSQAASASGYLLSPVTNVSLNPVTTNDRFGYELNFRLPVGSDDPDRTAVYEYDIVATSKGGTTLWQETYSDADISGQMGRFFDFARNVTREEEEKELQKIEITVKYDGMTTSTATSNIIADIPDGIDTMEASSNSKPLSSDSPNSRGVYPVHVRWTTESTSPNFTLFRQDQDGNLTKFNVSGREYTDESTMPLVIYEYWIEAKDALGRTFGEPHAANSYGAVTLEVYKDMFESLSLKPWDKQSYVPSEYRTWWKNTEVAKKIEKGNSSSLTTQMDALGSASASAHFHNGRVDYNASMNGIGAIISFTYTNFGENANWWMNGQYSMDVDASGTGSASTATNGFDIQGMYPGHIGLEEIRVSSKAFTGRYTIRYDYGTGESTTAMVDV